MLLSKYIGLCVLSPFASLSKALSDQLSNWSPSIVAPVPVLALSQSLRLEVTSPGPSVGSENGTMGSPKIKTLSKFTPLSVFEPSEANLKRNLTWLLFSKEAGRAIEAC